MSELQQWAWHVHAEQEHGTSHLNMRRSFLTWEGGQRTGALCPERDENQAVLRGLSIHSQVFHGFAELCGCTHCTGAQLRLDAEGLNAYSASAAHLQMLHAHNPESQVGAQMSARS